eukprot:TRINITY_DN2225_c0_g1_i3.p1 TRINITY_DN2225_c0_g1~~TRINITY_DN2225_c0_g1_i3.p1  ORF type:complete len:481 (-),score=102.25 TRINITY_DN2225_c0_g1_i3:202-1611(-)
MEDVFRSGVCLFDLYLRREKREGRSLPCFFLLCGLGCASPWIYVSYVALYSVFLRDVPSPLPHLLHTHIWMFTLLGYYLLGMPVMILQLHRQKYARRRFGGFKPYIIQLIVSVLIMGAAIVMFSGYGVTPLSVIICGGAIGVGSSIGSAALHQLVSFFGPHCEAWLYIGSSLAPFAGVLGVFVKALTGIPDSVEIVLYNTTISVAFILPACIALVMLVVLTMSFGAILTSSRAHKQLSRKRYFVLDSGQPGNPPTNGNINEAPGETEALLGQEPRQFSNNSAGLMDDVDTATRRASGQAQQDQGGNQDSRSLSLSQYVINRRDKDIIIRRALFPAVSLTLTTFTTYILVAFLGHFGEIGTDYFRIPFRLWFYIVFLMGDLIGRELGGWRRGRAEAQAEQSISTLSGHSVGRTRALLLAVCSLRLLWGIGFITYAISPTTLPYSVAVAFTIVALHSIVGGFCTTYPWFCV